MTAPRVPDSRWRPRPVASFLVRTAVFLVPLLVALGVVLAASRLIPPPADLGVAFVWWLVITAAATATLLLVDRAARRLLPLATLLRLSLAFPDAPPSRYRVARTAASSRTLRRRVEAARAGHGDDATAAAETALAMLASLRAHDRRTRGHAERVLLYTELLAEELGLDDGERDRLRWGALLHDIGKLSVPVELLNKSSRLGPDEWALIHRHPEEGMRLCAPLLVWLGEWRSAIGQHHEQWDGSGYPLGLAGEEIGRGARIVAVADAYEVMTAPRPYSRAIAPHAARAELTRCAGVQFDPAVVRAFLNVALGPLRRAMGPMALVTQVPILARLASASPQTALASTAGVGTAAVVSAGLVLNPLPGPSAQAEVDTPAADSVIPLIAEEPADGWSPALLSGDGPPPAEPEAPGDEPVPVQHAEDEEPAAPSGDAGEDPPAPEDTPAVEPQPAPEPQPEPVPADAPEPVAEPTDESTGNRGATPAEPGDPGGNPAKPAQPPDHAQGSPGD